MFDLRWLRSLARLVSDWLWKNNTALSTALATLRPVARWFCEVLMLELIPCRESRFWRVAKPRTMLLDMEYHPFWVTDKGPLRDPEIFSQPACHGRDRNAARRRSGNLRFSPQRSSIKGDALS